MEKILELFQFADTTWGNMAGRFGVLLLLTLIVAWIAALSILLPTKKKEHKVAFHTWFWYCLMWAVVAAVTALCIVSIITVCSNGFYWFGKDSMAFNLYCGYVLMLPEILLLALWCTAFGLAYRKIDRSF